MLTTSESRLLSYKQSLRSAWGFNDYNDWPIKFNSIMHLFLEEFADEFLSDLTAIQDRDIPLDEVSKAFGNPARIYRVINPVIYGMKRRLLPLQEQRHIVLLLLDMVKRLKYGSEFNGDGANIILSNKDLASLQKNIEMEQADPKSSAELHRFCGIMWAYTEAVFFRAHDVTKEIHGPYKVERSLNSFLIREYLNLCPRDIWKDVPLLPCNTVTIYAEYAEALDICIDAYNHLFLRDGNFLRDLVAFGIQCDGSKMELKDLGAFIPTMLKTIESIHAWTSDAEWQCRAKRYADIYWYRKRPLRDLLGADWRVPEKVYEQIDLGQADRRRLNNLSMEQIDLLISTIL